MMRFPRHPAAGHAVTAVAVLAITGSGMAVIASIGTEGHAPAGHAPPQAQAGQQPPHVTASHPAAPRTAHGTVPSVPPSPVASLSPVLALRIRPEPAAAPAGTPAASRTTAASAPSSSPSPHPAPTTAPTTPAPTPAPTRPHPSCLISLDALGVAVCASISIGG